MRENSWRKASATYDAGNCVEISLATDEILVRDSKDGTGPRLRFTRAEWQVFQGRLAGFSGQIDTA
jgi:hypothetical protein